MRVGFCQFDVVHKNVDANIAKIKELIRNVDADLIVLPELCISGYFFQSKDELFLYSSERVQKRIIRELTTISKRNDVYIVAGIAEKEGDSVYNTAIVVGDKGLLGKHRKVNLSKNETIFSRGNKLAIITIGDVKIGIVICFESWFPESFRLLALQGAQIICCPVNFGGPWTLDVMKVRALENKVYTIMANRIGQELIKNEKADFRGESQIIDYGGNVLVSAGREECLKIVEIHPDDVLVKNNIICDDLLYEMSMYKRYVHYDLYK
ncbi:MAG: hypothetical protein JRH15_08845 [Deltaproteobacteria bacterium]|nr:hypothetical protein [Deltaproteobacteria bacterium]